MLLKTRQLTIASLVLLLVFAVTNIGFASNTISILAVEAPHTSYLADFEDDFAAKTGFQIDLDILPERAYHSKLQMLLATGSDEYDIVYVPQRFSRIFTEAGWIQPLDKFLADPDLTSADYNYEDILAGARTAFSSPDGIPYAIPNMFAAFILFYNKEMFAEAGLDGPPQTLEELEEYAAKLTKPDQAGIVLRATRESALGTATWIIFRMIAGDDPNFWLDEDLKPILDSDIAIEITEYWARMLNNYGPPGVAAYGWEEAALAFEQGRAAMIIDDQIFGPARFENEELSNIVGKVGYSYIPGKTDQFVFAPGWGFGIPTSNRNPEGAWKFIQYATQKESFEHAVRLGMGGTIPRESVLKGDLVAELYNTEWATAVIEALRYAHPECLSPPLVEGPRIREELAIGIDRVLAGQASAAEALKEVNKRAFEILKDAGYY